MNNETLSIQSSGNLLLESISLKTKLCSLNHTLQEIEKSSNTALKKVEFNIRNSVYVSGSGVGSFIRSSSIFHKCGKKVHFCKEYSSTGNGYIGNPYQKTTNKLPEWVAKKPVVSYTKYLATFNITCNNNSK